MAALDTAYREDLEAVFDREWIAVAHVDQLAEPGDFVTRVIGTEPVVVLRNATGELCAHLNVCRHRGSQILRGEGRVKALKCPYHGWMYSLDGELRGAPEMKYSACFDKADYGLIGLAVIEWRGLVLVNFDGDARAPSRATGPGTGATAGEEWEVELDWRTALDILQEAAPPATPVVPNLVLFGNAEAVPFAYVLPRDARLSTIVAGHRAGGEAVIARLRRSLEARAELDGA